MKTAKSHHACSIHKVCGDGTECDKGAALYQLEVNLTE